MSSIAFEAIGRPAPQGSKRHVGRGILIESSKRLAPWRNTVVASALAARRPADAWPLVGPVEVTIGIYLHRPASHYRTGRHADQLRDDAPLCPATRSSGDVDKLARAILDALTDAAVIRDDAQVAELFVGKFWIKDSEPEKATVYVREINEWD